MLQKTLYFYKRRSMVNFVHSSYTKYTNYHAPCQLCGNDQRLRSGFNFRQPTAWDAPLGYMRYLWFVLVLYQMYNPRLHARVCISNTTRSLLLLMVHRRKYLNSSVIPILYNHYYYTNVSNNCVRTYTVPGE